MNLLKETRKKTKKKTACCRLHISKVLVLLLMQSWIVENVNVKWRRWKNIRKCKQWKAMRKARGEVQETLKASEWCTLEILHTTQWIGRKGLDTIQISAWIYSSDIFYVPNACFFFFFVCYAAVLTFIFLFHSHWILQNELGATMEFAELKFYTKIFAKRIHCSYFYRIVTFRSFNIFPIW